MLTIFSIIILCLFISLIWLNYFKEIDLFEKEKSFHIVVTFLLGTIIPFSIYLIHHYCYAPLGIENSSNPVSSFLFFVFGVGLLEEVIKFLPVFFVLYLFKSAINEPLDYLKYIAVSALGFAFGENIEYALNYGNHVLLLRAILSVPGHLFFSCLFIYGFIEHKYFNKPTYKIAVYMLYGALAHGIYDYLLDFKIQLLGKALHFIFFALMISVFINMLNNCLNHSPFYSVKKVIDQEKIRTRLFTLYAIAFFAILILTGIVEGKGTAASLFFTLIFFNGSILSLIIVRLSRFDINLKEVIPIKLEFPFRLFNGTESRNDIGLFNGLFVIKGESYNSAKIASLFNDEIKIIPLSKNKSYLRNVYTGVIEGKIKHKGQMVYVLRLFVDVNQNKGFFLIAKTNGQTHNPDGHPFASLNSINPITKKIIFHEWVVLKKQSN